MYVERELRNQLNALSKEVFGVASKWQKMLETTEPVTLEVVETVKNEDGTESQKTTKRPGLYNPNPLDTKNPNGHQIRQAVRRTPEQILEQLQGFKKQLDDLKAQMKAEQDAKEAAEKQKQLEQSVREAAHGSAV